MGLDVTTEREEPDCRWIESAICDECVLKKKKKKKNCDDCTTNLFREKSIRKRRISLYLVRRYVKIRIPPISSYFLRHTWSFFFCGLTPAYPYPRDRFVSTENPSLSLRNSWGSSTARHAGPRRGEAPRRRQETRGRLHRACCGEELLREAP